MVTPDMSSENSSENVWVGGTKPIVPGSIGGKTPRYVLSGPSSGKKTPEAYEVLSDAIGPRILFSLM